MSDAAARDRNENTEAGPHGAGLRVPFSAGDTQSARGSLSKLVAAKLALDLLFVCALAAYAHVESFRPAFDGEVEPTDGEVVRGWVAGRARPGETFEVQLFVDGSFAAAGVADEPQPDSAGRQSAEGARRGFVFRLGSERNGEHEARVYAVRAGRGGERRTLELVGVPRRFVRR